MPLVGCDNARVNFFWLAVPGAFASYWNLRSNLLLLHLEKKKGEGKRKQKREGKKNRERQWKGERNRERGALASSQAPVKPLPACAETLWIKRRSGDTQKQGVVFYVTSLCPIFGTKFCVLSHVSSCNHSSVNLTFHAVAAN